MWLVKVAILVLVVVCAVAGQDDCFYSLDIKYKLGSQSPRISLVNAPDIDCSYRIKAPFGTRIQVSCELSQPRACNFDEVIISPSGREDLANATHVGCADGKVRKESEANSLFLRMRSSSESQNGQFICTLSLVQPNCRCRGKNENMGRIVNGVEAVPNEFPMMAGLFVQKYHFCGATIISEYYALTAAHCLITNDILMLAVGRHYIANDKNPHSKLYRIITSIVHPGYTQEPGPNDIGLVRTESRIEFNPDVGSVCLPWKFRESTFTGESLEATGWGTMSYQGTASRVLMKVNLDVIDNVNCSIYWRKPQITSGQICTYTPKKDTCQGDSGGPIFYTEPESERLYLVGIVSYGYGCATHKPAVYTRVSAYLDWIKTQTSDTSYCVM
ncbi:venom serine protease-like [Culex pipiens pallens]|uniref:venom serine protease-like n=1 Tax=Culex pipiens pallens TaxID=42434 RepID=UPI0022AA81D4|nr:venom serine protease-like [Culex pipiens pallens]